MFYALMKIAILTLALYKFYYCLFEIQRGYDFVLELKKNPEIYMLDLTVMEMSRGNLEKGYWLAIRTRLFEGQTRKLRIRGS